MKVNDAGPRVSVVMANLNGAAHIADAVRSVLRQSERALELIISDDGSQDDSLARARAAAAGDPRVVILESQRQTGPAAARNRALDIARGRWIAVVDNDDYIHPQRLQRLIDAAEREGADIVADDSIVFYEDGARRPHAHLRGALAERPHWISAAAYERSNRLLGPGPALGYLKPIFRRSSPEAPRYDERLRIGEDSDFILRMLMNGARMRVYPEPGYFYRKHAGSISHRLDAAAVDALSDAYAARDPGADLGLGLAFAAQRAALADARAFADFVAAVKARDAAGAARTALRRPGALLLLRDALGARLLPRPARRRLPGPRVTFISRQRIVGAVNGSSAYVLALAGALKEAGFAVDYIGASPKIFGRWAALRLKPEIAAFDRYCVHGGVRLGSFVFALDPAVWLTSVLAVLERGLARIGLSPGWSQPAEYAQGAAATRADMLYVARRAPAGAQAVLCDYAYLAPMAAYALSPGAPALVIMHDLISARVADPAESATQKVTQLSAAAEFALLGLADGAIAIQAEEAERVRAALPGSRVVLAPHGVSAVGAPQPGEDDLLLFVGSNTAPNIVGLDWFLREIWPEIRAARPGARLKVAGSVARALGAPPEGVSMLGVVDDLAPLYREAGVVISPLYTGSGLKIKLVEALAAGKAVVGASVTAQGVEAVVGAAMVLADDPGEFAAATAALLGNRARREALAGAALACAREHFSTQAAFRELVEYVRGYPGDAAPGVLQARAAAPQ
jgi:GT2 family glycosyltransferase/glycosyltransferase involved in cell wall biosynthesis